MEDGAFHDRFILFGSEEGNNIIYMLSNSLNSLMNKYDFSMVKMEGYMNYDANRYINKIHDKCVKDKIVWSIKNEI